MSSVFNKNKGKRPRTSSNEANNSSFVKNVTSRVSGLLPSTITKWFSSPSTSNANGSAQMADATDSSTEDEACETPVITQPPSKRMRYNSPGSFSHYGSQDAHCSTSNIEITELPYNPYSSSQFSQSSRNTYPSGFRSSNEDPSQEKNDRDMKMYRPQHTVAGIGQSIANKRKSIFESTSNQEEEPNSYSKSSNSSRQNEPKHSNFKHSLLGSPFYPGRTMYGGAASSYINQPNITQHRVAVVNESKINEDIAMSSSARRILEILESSSPLTEARRIPVYTRPKNDKFYKTSEQSSFGNRSYSYKTQELHVPNYASILRLKKKSRLMDTTNAARQIIASQSSTSNYPNYPASTKGNEIEKEQSHKLTTKMKTKITKINRGNQDEVDVATPVILPTGVLKINKDQMPNISFGIPVIHKAPVSSTPKPIPVKSYSVEKSRKPETARSDFIFASPVKVSSDTPQTDITTPKFTFDRPEQQIDKKFESKYDDCSVVVGNPKEIEKPIPASKEWQCPDCWVKNKPDSSSCVCCGHKRPSQNAKCTVCKLADSQSQKDKCVNCEKLQILKGTESVSAEATGISQTAKWKCEDCWVSNEDSAAKCACCGARKPNKSSGVPTNVISSISTTGSQDADWKCGECWISNKSSVDKCAACGSAKPGSKQSKHIPAPPKAPSFFGSTDDKFKKIVESQKSEKWECSSCLVRNDSDISKCACCGQAKESTNKMPESKFNFGTTPNNTFKFGIDPKAQETAKAKMPELKPALESKLKEHSETNNNVLSETPSFTFTLPTKVLDGKNDKTTNSIPNDAPKMNFSFGIPKPIAISAATNKLSEPKTVEEKEKIQEVPNVDLNSVNDKPKPFGNIFMSPLTQLQTTNDDKTQTTPVSGTSLQNPVTADVKKETENNLITTQSAPTSDDSANKPTFTFGLKPSSNLFETPASTAAPINLFTQQTQTTSLTTNTAAPTMSLFKPPESTTTTASLFQSPDRSSVTPAALFQKSDTNNTVMSNPVFSFGTNAQNNTSLTSTQEKPKFQFTFGNNTAPKTETALFKSPFGSTENNTTTNSFALPQGATLNSGNPLSSSTLGGANGLPAPNGLTGNALGAMPGNPLMGNSLPTGNSPNPAIALGGANGLSMNPLAGGNTMTGSATGIFGNPIKNENVWSTANNSPTPNLFVSHTATSSLQKPATFTFGSSTSFNNPPQPAFGNNTAQSPVMFGMSNQNNNNNNNQSLLFSNAASSQPTPNLFGSPQPPSNSVPQMGLFGTPNIGSTPTFGTPNPSIPTFEPPSLTPAPAPAFNFGAPQSTGIFGFGQQHPMQSQQQPQLPQLPQLPHSPQQTGVYSFGGTPAGAPHVQFTVGSGPNTAVRRVRKAVRRNPQR